jgi:hypothetical protein
MLVKVGSGSRNISEERWQSETTVWEMLEE